MTGEPLDALVELYAGPTAQRLYDEAVTELEHALQCAALADAAGAAPAVVAASLLHDVGHLVLDDNLPIDEHLDVDHGHDRAGARALARWFGPEVTAPVAMHVAAKRYLVAVDAGYAATLSPSSVRSLAVQGGPMDADEIAVFERHPACEAAVQVRRFDDTGKVAGLVVRDFEWYLPLLRSLAR